MENIQPTTDEEQTENDEEELRPDFNPPWMADQEPADRKRDLKERYFLTRKELRDCQRLLSLRDEELRKLRLTERRQVELSHEEENLRASTTRLQSRIDELKRQLTDSRNQIRQARTEAAEKSALVPILEKETSELREQLEAGEKGLGELSGLLEQRERELQEKNGSLHEAHEISDRLDQRERDLLEIEEQLHATREQLGPVRNELESTQQAVETLTAERDGARGQLDSLRDEVETARQTMETLTGERDEMVIRLGQAEASQRHADDTVKMLQDKLMETGEELVKLEESVRDYRYLMETLKREKTDLEAASVRAVGDLENKVEASRNECEGLRDIITVRQQEHEQLTAEKNELAASLEQEQDSSRSSQASLEEAHTREIDELKAKSTSELTGMLRAHAQEIDKLKMGAAGELGEMRDTANRLQSDFDASRVRSGRLQSELDEARQESDRLCSELEEARQGIPRLVARLEEKEQAIADTRALLLDAMSRMDGLDQPPELALGHDQPPENASDEMWPIG